MKDAGVAGAHVGAGADRAVRREQRPREADAVDARVYKDRRRS
jgi:hypothetical protein